MHTSEKGMALIKLFEGLRLTPYECPGGYKTIGYGHVLSKEEASFIGEITEDQAEDFLFRDIEKVNRSLKRLVTIRLHQNQWDALASFVFNLGAGAFQRSALRRTVNRADHEDVPHQLMKWIWAGGRKQKGLIRRRTAEGMLYSQSLVI
jgi:lysozyme